MLAEKVARFCGFSLAHRSWSVFLRVFCLPFIDIHSCSYTWKHAQEPAAELGGGGVGLALVALGVPIGLGWYPQVRLLNRLPTEVLSVVIQSCIPLMFLS